jgi:stage V sporulation protein SpoVS
MHVFRACLQNPANPTAAWKQIVLADKENVDQMRQFFLRKKVDLQDIKNVKNSCLHRVLSCVSSSWEAIEKTAQILCATKLKPLEIAILATQADDIEGVAVGITAFGTALAALQVSRTSMVPTGVMEGIVRLSNFLAFTHDGDQSSRTAIEAGVAAILSDLAPVPRDMLIHVISMIPATVLLEGSLCTVVNDLQNSGLAGFGKKDFWELLCVGGALTAMANGSLPTAIEAMRLAGFEKRDFLKLLCVNGALTAMANGSLPTAIEAMRLAGFEKRDFLELLCVGGALTAMANGSLPTAIEAMRLAGFEKKDFLKLLCVGGALTAMANGSLPTAIEAMRLAGFEKKDFLKLLCVNGALTAMANGSLPTAIEAMGLAGFGKKDFLELLCVDGALTAMAKGSLPTAIETLRKEGIPGNLCTMILRRNGMIAHLANGDFSIVTYLGTPPVRVRSNVLVHYFLDGNSFHSIRSFF